MPVQKILVVVESLDENDSSGSKANVAMIKNLHTSGFQLKVCHYTSSDVVLANIPCIQIPENRRSPLFFLSRAERQLRLKLNLDLHQLLEKIFGFSFTLFNDRNSIVRKLKGLGEFEPDLIITLSKGGSFRPHHALLKMPELHHKWLAYIHDPYPMHLYPRPYAWVEPGYLQKWKFIKAVSQKARLTAFPSELLREWMGSYFKDFLNKSIVIPHQINEEHYKTNSFPDYFEPKKFNLVHAGNLLHARNPEGLIKGYRNFLERNPEAVKISQLTFIGSTLYFSKFLEKISEEVAGLTFIAQNRSLEEVNSVQRNASVNIILEAKSEISPFLPGKFANCVLADKPILLLGPYYSESRRLLGSKYEYWSEIDDVNKITDLIEKLYNAWGKTDSLQLNRPDLKQYLSAKRLKELISSAVKVVAP